MATPSYYPTTLTLQTHTDVLALTGSATGDLPMFEVPLDELGGAYLLVRTSNGHARLLSILAGPRGGLQFTKGFRVP